jgi:hypothetical protein
VQLAASPAAGLSVRYWNNWNRVSGDLQQWVRNSNLEPDWLRVGTDIVGGTTFNGSFSLIGEMIAN